MSDSDSINYARFEGIYKSELAGAVIFAIAYAPLFVYNVLRSIQRPTYVLIMLAVFCICRFSSIGSAGSALTIVDAVRIAAFVLRALIAGSDTAGQNIGLVIASSIIYGVGFFGLLYSAYTLVLDREQMLGYENRGKGLLAFVRRVVRMKQVVRLTLIAAVTLSVVSESLSSSDSPSTQKIVLALRRASLYIFLVVAIVLVLLTADLAWEEHGAGTRSATGKIGNRHALYFLTAIGLLCLMRESFFVATVANILRQNNAHIYYPLGALPEFLAVCLFSVPGLVPSRKEIAKREMGSPETVELNGARRGSDLSV